MDDNLVILCGGCHREWHGARRRAVGRALRPRLSKSEVKYVRQKKGGAWLEIHYGKGVQTP